MYPSRRRFMGIAGSAAAGAAVSSFPFSISCQHNTSRVPPHLAGYRDEYTVNPRQASKKWFDGAGYGLFMHYGLYSLLGRHEWVQFRETIPLEEYTALKDRFTAARFDPAFITDLALDAGMKYITITAKHHEGFCLFETAGHDYHAAASPAKRDLIGELADACHKTGLGLFLYYSYAADWWHPYFYSRDAGWQSARPAYKVEPNQYKWRRNEDFRIYVDYVHAQLRELLTGYGPLAGIWFDPIMGYYARPDLFPIGETYQLVRTLQPHALISFKQGATGDEDFAAPERSGHSLYERVKKDYPANADIAGQAWESNKDKKIEICDTLQPHGWGYMAEDDGRHKSSGDVLTMIENAAEINANLLLNTGPLPDGSIHPEDMAALREAGKRLKNG